MASERCPCGSGDPFSGCCAPALRGEPAPTPEALMRSRYTAFAVGDGAYLAATWHPGTRPDDTEPDAGIRWSGLEILDAPPPTSKRGVVEFRARYRSGGAVGELHERSRFVFQSGRWWYLDGATPGTGSAPGS
jgi:SEC-C motif-containing protein